MATRDLGHTIPIAESFYSIQGEGPTAGTPAVFLRTSHCNLTCPGWGPPGSPHGCDTTAVWSRVHARLTPDEIVEWWESEGWLRRFSEGALLVLTGGEPLLWQRQLSALVERLRALFYRPYVEVETNATILPTVRFDAFVDRWNCSPKLSSAGNPREKAYVPDVLEWFVDNSRAIFKFVVQSPSDVDEIESDFVKRFSISPMRIWLMPESTTRREFLDKAPEVAELAKAGGYRFSPRLQLLIWNQATGV